MRNWVEIWGQLSWWQWWWQWWRRACSSPRQQGAWTIREVPPGTNTSSSSLYKESSHNRSMIILKSSPTAGRKRESTISFWPTMRLLCLQRPICALEHENQTWLAKMMLTVSSQGAQVPREQEIRWDCPFPSHWEIFPFQLHQEWEKSYLCKI